MVAIKPGIVDVGGIKIRNHTMLAAGILGTTGASLSRVLSAGAGGVVTKSIGPEPMEGHHGPCIAVPDYGLINAMGLPNPSRNFISELENMGGKPVIVSIFGGTPKEFGEVASWFTDLAQGFELNLSCPHAEGYGAALGSDPSMIKACTHAVKDYGLPTWVKLTPNVTDITACGIAAEKGGADAIVAINTIKAMRISTGLRRPVLGNRFGGLSGKAIFPVAIRCVYELYESCSLPIIGCGGVSSAEDVIEMMMAGASAVEIGTAVMEGISIFSDITSSLYDDSGEEASSIVGCAHD